MNRALFTSHYTLITIAIVVTAFLQHTDELKVYTLLILLYTALDTVYYQFLHKLRLFRKAWFPLLQALVATYLCLQYEGYLYLLFFAILILLHPGHKQPIDNIMIILLWGLLNIVLFIQQLDFQIMLLNNILYIVMVVALLLIRRLFNQKDEIQSLYDALRKRHYELETARSQLLEHAKLVELVAQTEERNRISKDIHDALGHQLIRVKMMMEAALPMLHDNKEKGMELLYEVRDQITFSMESLRKTVRQLKPGDSEIRSMSLSRLAKNFSHDSGVEVELNQSGQPQTLMPSVEVVLFRNAQEALTNAVRHGRATRIWMRLHFAQEEVKLSITNDGEIPDKPLQKGLGIQGMVERTELLGGTVTVKVDNHFQITTAVPLPHISKQ